MLLNWRAILSLGFCPVIISQCSLCAAEEIWGLLFMTHNGRVTKSLWLSGCAPKLWKHPECEPTSPAPVLPTVRVQYISARDAPVWCCDPHDPIIASESKPSSRGVQARSNLKTSEWRGSGLWTCGRSGNGCRSLHASANPWLSRSQWRCSGHRRRPQRWTITQDKFLNTFSILLCHILHICSEIPIPEIFL